jgi:hypothetical protein
MVIWVLVVCLVGLHLGGLWVRYHFYVLREFFRILFTRTEVATPRRSMSLLSSRLAHSLGFACSFQAWQNSSVPINPKNGAMWLAADHRYLLQKQFSPSRLAMA